MAVIQCSRTKATTAERGALLTGLVSFLSLICCMRHCNNWEIRGLDHYGSRVEDAETIVY